MPKLLVHRRFAGSKVIIEESVAQLLHLQLHLSEQKFRLQYLLKPMLLQIVKMDCKNLVQFYKRSFDSVL